VQDSKHNQDEISFILADIHRAVLDGPQKTADILLNQLIAQPEILRGPGYSSIRFQTIRQQSNKCHFSCLCACHARGQMQTPRLLRYFFGALFMCYSGLPVIRARCTEKKCTRQNSTYIQVNYQFPTWMLTQVRSMMITYHRLDGPKLTLSTRRVITYEGRVLEYARRGNIEGMQTLFMQGLASPQDVSSVGGSSVLHVSFQQGC
jgi:hypothetical protein